MNTARNIFLGLFLLSVLVILVGGLFWASLNFAQSNPGGAEFYRVWSGARAYSVNALNPYGVIVSEQVQRLVYGRLARAGEPIYRVDVPLHYLLLFTPLALVDEVAQARAWWMVFSQVALIALTLMGVSLAQWRTALPMRVALVLFGVFWVHSALAVIDGSLIVVVALLFAAALLALRAESDELAGILLAFATVKAEAGILFLIYILLWSGVQGRWGVWGGFIMTLIVLAGVSWLFQPDWGWEFARAVFANLNSGPLVGLGVLLEARLPGVGARASQ
ncbi:MAG: glycosyltransferase 87 family protein, partial [Anaerolineales bacterium]